MGKQKSSMITVGEIRNVVKDIRAQNAERRAKADNIDNGLSTGQIPKGDIGISSARERDRLYKEADYHEGRANRYEAIGAAARMKAVNTNLVQEKARYAKAMQNYRDSSTPLATSPEPKPVRH